MVVLVCLLSIGAVGADEVRGSYIVSQLELDFKPRGAERYRGEWDEDAAYELAAYSNRGWVWGFGIYSQRAELADQDFDLEYESWLLRMYSGQAPVQTASFTWEITGFTGLGFGSADLSRTAPGRSGGSDRSFMFDFGGQTTLSMRLTRYFLIGAGVGYQWSEVDLDLDGERTIEQEGLYYIGYAGLTF